VLLFFVHTSLVLMGSIERTDTDPNWVRHFYVRRAGRIYPLAVVTVLAVIATHMRPAVPVLHAAMTVAPSEPSLRTIASNVALLQNLTGDPNVLTVLWSLPIEVQMYFVLPACYLLARRGVMAVGYLVIASIIAGSVWVAYQSSVPGLWRLSTVQFGPCFLAGILAYAILRNNRTRQLPSMVWLPAIAVALMAYWAVGFEAPAAQWALCLTIGLAIPAVRELPESVFSRAAAVVAKYSYGIYLLHIPALRLALALLRGAPTPVILTTAVVLTAAFAWVGFHLIERPGIELGKLLASRHLPVARQPVPAFD
jgi:peptidoglycan/LPS O-acetylase OafA/YrhL